MTAGEETVGKKGIDRSGKRIGEDTRTHDIYTIVEENVVGYLYTE